MTTDKQPPIKNTGKGLTRLINSFQFALKGIAALIKTQANARIHALATVVVLGSGFLFEVNATEWCLLIICIGGVWTAEGLNTAIEALTDLVSPNYHPLAGRAKDVAAGAVLISAIAAAMVAAIVFLPKILTLLEINMG